MEGPESLANTGYSGVCENFRGFLASVESTESFYCSTYKNVVKKYVKTIAKSYSDRCKISIGFAYKNRI